MNLLLLPVPLWGIGVLTIIAYFVVEAQRRRLSRRVNDLYRIINNMDRWADEIEDRLYQSEQRSGYWLQKYNANNNTPIKRSRHYR